MSMRPGRLVCRTFVISNQFWSQIEAISDRSSMFCQNCGRGLESSFAFCPNCGAKVEAETSLSSRDNIVSGASLTNQLGASRQLSREAI